MCQCRGALIRNKTGQIMWQDSTLCGFWCTSFMLFCLLVSGFFPPQHPAEHQLQDVCEERELSDHAHEPKPVPALPLQEMPLCWHVKRWWDILTHFYVERDPHAVLPECHSALISQSSREMGSPKAAQRWYVGLCEKCNAESLLRSSCQ